MGQALREIAIVCQEEEAFGLRIEPADIEETGKAWRQEVKDRVAGVRIAAGRDETGGFVQHDIEPARIATQQFAIHLHVIALGRLRAKIGADAAIDGDAAAGDQLITLPSRANARRGQKAVEAHGKS